MTMLGRKNPGTMGGTIIRLALGVVLLAVGSMGPACSDVSVYEQQGYLVVAPTAVDFGTVATGALIEQQVKLTNSGQATVEITEMLVQGGDGAFELVQGHTGQIGEGEAVDIIVTFTSPVTDDFMATLLINSDAQNPELESTVWGATRTPGIFAYPEFVDFGATELESSEALPLYVENDGLVDVDILTAAIDPDDAPFTVTSPEVLGGGFPATVPAGYAGELTVTFTPVDEDPVGATLILTTSDPENTEISVPLHGNDCDANFHPDFDADGDGYVTCVGDCDDTDPDINPGAEEVCDDVDEDCDGLVDNGTECYDDDGDGYAEIDGDCVDGDDTVYPGALEVTDGYDNDCDGLIDENPNNDDDDGDGYTENGGDCDDTDPTVYPGAPEICDGLDNDCNPGTDIDVGTECYDDDGDGFTENNGDCNDNDQFVYPGATDFGGGVDWDCDGMVNGVDNDGDGYTVEGGDCNDNDPLTNPAQVEQVDGLDNDCDGIADEETYAYDDDGDGFCEGPACTDGSWVGDCNDGDPSAYLNGPEVLDGVDNDCDGDVDEGTEAFDDDGDGYTEQGGDCDDGDPAINPGAWDQSVDGVDDDCDGTDGQ